MYLDRKWIFLYQGNRHHRKFLSAFGQIKPDEIDLQFYIHYVLVEVILFWNHCKHYKHNHVTLTGQLRNWNSLNVQNLHSDSLNVHKFVLLLMNVQNLYLESRRLKIFTLTKINVSKLHYDSCGLTQIIHTFSCNKIIMNPAIHFFYIDWKSKPCYLDFDVSVLKSQSSIIYSLVFYSNKSLYAMALLYVWTVEHLLPFSKYKFTLLINRNNFVIKINKVNNEDNN